MSSNKLQSLLITHLQKHGSVKLVLPDGVTLEIGINQLDDDGNLKTVENYCWVMVNRQDRMAILDSYNLGVRFAEEENALIFEDIFTDSEGKTLRRFDVV